MKTKLIAVTIVLGFMVGLVLVWPRNKVHAPSSVQPTVAPIKSGSLSLLSSSSKTVFQKTETIPLLVTADSDGLPITGYDVIITYDSSKMTFVKAESLIADFQIVPQNAPDSLTITSYKKLSMTNKRTLSGTPILQITFKPKASGVVVFALSYSENSTKDSNLMTDETNPKDILRRVNGLSVKVE